MLSADAEALLAQIGGGRPAFETMTAEQARRLSKANRAGTDVVVQAMESVEDLVIPGPTGPLSLRRYRPNGSPKSPPAVVFLHGGGWVIGDLDSHDAMCRRIASASGFVVIAVDYRLAPEHRCPAAVDDAEAALRWVADNAALLDVDAEHLAIAGDSAGANIAAVVARRIRDTGGPLIRLQLLIYPLTDSACATPSWSEFDPAPFVSAESMAWFWQQYVGDGDGRHPDASPLQVEDLSGLPPAVVITAGNDVLRDEGEQYGRRLAEAGVPVTVQRYDGAFHGFFGFVDQLAAARAANTLAVGALVEALLPAHSPGIPSAAVPHRVGA